MADWCDLTLGNPLDEQPDFDGEQTPPSASQSAKTSKPPRVQWIFGRRSQSAKSSKTSRICGQWTFSGLSVDFQWTFSGLSVDFHQWTSSGLPVDFQWTCHFGGGQRRVFGRKWTRFLESSPVNQLGGWFAAIQFLPYKS
ncbi:hypothetical protein E4U46_004856 [Claviceps purpurea]|nr:hypothetical protein E4U46_004856 [Claviceps purpurea]